MFDFITAFKITLLRVKEKRFEKKRQAVANQRLKLKQKSIRLRAQHEELVRQARQADKAGQIVEATPVENTPNLN